MRVLVIGGEGQIGLELTEPAWPDGVIVHRPKRAEVDLTNFESVDRIVNAEPWSCVVNVAAFTAVDNAENSVEACWRANALGPAILGQITRDRGIPIVHLSTDYVFDGTKSSPYVEADPTAPLGVYGASKLAGEEAIRTTNPLHAIVRTAWVVSPHRTNFLLTMLNLAVTRRQIPVVDDQVGSPTSAADVAAAVSQVALRLAKDASAPTGTFHFVNAGEASWCSFAEAIVTMSAARDGPFADIVPIPTEEYPTPAPRPRNSRLATDRIEAAFGLKPRAWQSAIGDVLDTVLTIHRQTPTDLGTDDG